MSVFKRPPVLSKIAARGKPVGVCDAVCDRVMVCDTEPVAERDAEGVCVWVRDTEAESVALGVGV